MTAEGVPQLLISQTGGTYIPLWYQEVPEGERDDPSSRKMRTASGLSQGSTQESLTTVRDDKESVVSGISMSGEEGKENATGKEKQDSTVS